VRLLDLFCCAGGAAMGYHQAGFEVVGVDIQPQPRYPFEFIQADALDIPALWQFDAIHASPPCQAYSNAQRLRKNDHPDLIGPVRERLIESGVPYVIENVFGAPLREPTTLCGGMFGLKVYRHRLFETSFPIWAPHHPPHTAKQAKMGRPPKEGEFIQVVGNFSGVEYARAAMGIGWMTRDELREAIPPAFTQFIGKQLLAHIQSQRLAA
jgi:DNA (cytosine-5)-methyltransferase 1